MPKALVVTEDAALLYAATQALQRLNLEIVVAHDVGCLPEKTGASAPDLLIADCALAADGANPCSTLRQQRLFAQTPLVAITPRDDRQAEIDALEAGADACVAKPLTADLLHAYLVALSRRTLFAAVEQHLRAGPIVMDLSRWVVSVDNRLVNLTKTEFRLLQVLIEARGRTLTRELLLNKVWAHSNVRSLQTKTVDVHIGRLRRKLGAVGHQIITVRDVGFRFGIMPEWIVGRTGSDS